jgi:hypothetical protein
MMLKMLVIIPASNPANKVLVTIAKTQNGTAGKEEGSTKEKTSQLNPTPSRAIKIDTPYRRARECFRLSKLNPAKRRSSIHWDFSVPFLEIIFPPGLQSVFQLVFQQCINLNPVLTAACYPTDMLDLCLSHGTATPFSKRHKE